MIIRRGKSIDSEHLKRSLDKDTSIKEAGIFSRAIKKGGVIKQCPLCSTTTFREIVEIYGFSYRECQGCKSAYVANPPSEEDLRAAYNSEYYTTSNKKLLANRQIIDYRIDQIAKPKVSFVEEHISTSKRTWLDIGCGVGEILSSAKNSKFQVLGIETNKMESDFARETFGIEVKNEYVNKESIYRYKGQFGVISLFSVLEHVLYPNELMNAISQIQEPGDTLVLEVPHYPSISIASQVSFPDKVNRMMHPPLHLFLFSMDALKHILGENDYDIRAAWFFGQDFYELFSTLGLFSNDLNGSVLHNAVSPLINDFQKVIDTHGLSDEVLVVAEKRTKTRKQINV